MLEQVQVQRTGGLRRVLAVTAGLAAAGAVAGAITGAVAAGFVIMVYFGNSVDPETGVRFGVTDLGFGMSMAAVMGAPIGAVILPLEAWVLLRRVPLWRALAETAAGTVVGAVALALIATSPVVGAMIGFTLAAVRLRFVTRPLDTPDPLLP